MGTDKQRAKALKIYLGCLSHETVALVIDTFPINVGFVASYAKKIFGQDIEVTLFKYPQSIIDAIQADPPDILALSNYSWNSHLSERVAEIAKQLNSSVVTVQGGTNFPIESHQQRDFLLDRPSTDFHVDLEGEISFSNLVSRVLEARDGVGNIFDRAIDGCVFIQPSTRFDREPALVAGVKPPRIRDLDIIPSPYLSGMMDHFFDGRLTPNLETNRGCPFKCSFCNTGIDYYQKSNMFSIERISEEIAYIAPRITAAGIAHLHIADTNFGMYPRDREICYALRKTYEEYNWPQQIIATTGKNNKERVIDITNIMGTTFSVNMSVQSMDQKVLANIKRDNIKLDDFVKINQHLQESGRTTKGELIMGMPGETKESFLNGLEAMIEANVSLVCMYTLMLLNGTEFKNTEYQKHHGIKGKFRVVPLNFGWYEGSLVLDCEEVGTESNDMPFEDYLYLRGFALFVETLHNGRPFEELFRHATIFGASRMDLLRRMYDRLDQAPQEVQELVDAFLTESRTELWDSEEELLAHYQDENQYERLLRGEAGGNLIYKYKTLGLAFTSGPWLDFIADTVRLLLEEKLAGATEAERIGAEDQLNALTQFCRHKLSGLLRRDSDLDPQSMSTVYDVVGWLNDNGGAPLTDYSRAKPIGYEFHYTEEQIATRNRMFDRYGAEPIALTKIITRITSLESWFRKVRTADGDADMYSNTDEDRFTRYTMTG
ncbi:radical SAM protein [SAR202 cluster bacterium AD-802-F09_MRT_200m]|nr:radical SAM protein [SAR202 cluster bacterium AD-802-F09_MRT_200m]